MTRLLEGNTELESCDTAVPHPVWPGVGQQDEGQLSQRDRETRNRDRHQGHELWKRPGYRDVKNHYSKIKNTESNIIMKVNEDRCFGIRHQPVSIKHEESDDSLLTNSVLLMTGFSSSVEEDYENAENVEEDDADKSREDMDRVIRELASAVRKSKGVSVLTNAVEKSKQKTTYNPAQEANQKHRRRKSIEERNSRQITKQSKFKDNLGYLSDGSDVSIPRRENIRESISEKHKVRRSSSDSSISNPDTFQLSAKRLHNKNLHKSVPKLNRYDQRPPNRNPRVAHTGVDPSSWFLARKEPRPFRTDLDFKNYQYNYGLFRAEEMFRVSVMEHQKKVKNTKPYKTSTRSAYVIERWNGNLVKKGKRKKRKSLIFFFKALCFLLLLSSFVLVIVAVSVLVL
jgi:hypothetical protein